MRLGVWPFGLLTAVAQTQQHQRQQQHPWSLSSFGVVEIPRTLTDNAQLAVQISRRRSTRPLLSGFILPIRSTRAPTNTKPNCRPPRLRWSHDPGRSRNVAHRPRTRPVVAGPSMMVVVVPSDDNFSPNSGLGGDNISLWLDMRTAILPAQQTLKALYDELRDREEAKGRAPGDNDWVFGRVSNPVGAVLFANEPEERAIEESETLIASGLRCFVLEANDRVSDVSTGNTVGVALDPAKSNAAGRNGGGINAAIAVAEAQTENTQREIVLLRGVRPSSWEDADMPNLLRITASACSGSGKTLVVTIKSVGQLHDTAMAALAAGQTKLLGWPAGGAAERGRVALLMEPMAELWEAGIMYL